MEVNTKLNGILNNLIKSSYVFDTDIAKLSEIVQLTSGNNENLIESSIIDKILNYKLDTARSTEDERLFRGLLLVVRNVASELDSEYMKVCIDSFHHVDQLLETNWIYKIKQVYWETLANFKRINGSMDQINDLFGWINFDNNNQFIKPIIHFLFRQLSTLDPEITNENLLKVLKLKNNNNILTFIQYTYQHLNFEVIDHDAKLFIHLLYDLITHESFENWINNQSPRVITDWLELTYSELQTKDEWNNYELVALISTNLSIFNKFSTQLTTVNDTEIERIIVVNLDIFSYISKYDIFIQYLKNETDSKFLNNLIKTFKIIHENIKPVTIKDKIAEIKYPNAKLNIVLILSYLTHDNIKIQEKIRELGGLALVLSNCSIDNNNPFIKEYSILCLKYLLNKNPENQKFVAELEAKKTLDDDVLNEVGYEVEIIDGKVAMKKKVDK
ncbi:unnamed protein product [Candida verbasci]|uniref:Ataxin-10 homolog n=1 Tax=Candida verbasci TaxID=1227364 RepID=A0A9W4U1W9_9ASCO|nr:unnamed protein product [Candida verbasci]